jgi:hypothetical protein
VTSSSSIDIVVFIVIIVIAIVIINKLTQRVFKVQKQNASEASV